MAHKGEEKSMNLLKMTEEEKLEVIRQAGLQMIEENMENSPIEGGFGYLGLLLDGYKPNKPESETKNVSVSSQ